MACAPSYHDRLVELAQGALSGPEADRLLEHVLSCPKCSEELDFLADLTTAVARVEPAPGKQPEPHGAQVLSLERPFWRRRAVLAAAAAILLAGIIAPIVLRNRPSLRELADIRPIPFVEGVLRSKDVEREPRFQEAMRSYSLGDFAAAAAALDSLLTADPDDHKLRI